jgi:2-methylcitrate dehydratase PrpD
MSTADLQVTPFAQLPPAAVAGARRALLDALGVMLAASGLSPETRPFVEFAASQGGAQEATILGTGRRAPAALAALANGAMAHALDFEDAFDRAPVHPNASSIPALLAMTEARAPLPYSELLTAIVVGCDVSCRLGLAMGAGLEHSGWYPPPLIGAFGATAAVARLLRLDARRVTDALSLLLLQNSAPGQIRHGAHNVIRAVREAFPAQAAVQCAQLAALGVPAFEAPFEGPGGLFDTFARGTVDVRPLLADLGERWLIEELSFKPWPCCRGTHAAVELALELRAQLATPADDVERILVRGGPVQAMLAQPLARKQAPQTAIDAKFSLPFTVATALLHGRVDFDSFAPAALCDPRVLALAARVQFELRPGSRPEQATSAQLQVRLRDGREIAVERLEPLGAPTRPLDDAALTDKFALCASRALQPWDAARARRFAGRMLTLDAATPLAGPLDAWLSPV